MAFPEAEGTPVIPLQLKAAWESWKLAILGLLALSLLITGFAIGYRWQAGNVAEAKAARDEATRTAQGWKDRAGSFEQATRNWQSRFEADEEADRAQRERAEIILERMEQQRQASERQAVEWRQRYEKAKQSPDCVELLKETTCAIFRSY